MKESQGDVMLPALSILSFLWSNPIARLVIVGGLAFGAGWVRGWEAYPRVDVAAITRNAEAGRDAEWSRKLAEQERIAQAAVDAAIAERDATPPAPVTDAELSELCRKPTSACRDKGR